LRKVGWAAAAVVGAVALGVLAASRGEPVNSLWIVVAAVCIHLIGYRFYSAWIAARVLVVDETRATPAERLDDGRDFVPTPRWITFGHHFAAISGPGPLVGPTLAAQFGFLPGLLWILVGAVLGGAVQDMMILFLSTRRDGRTLGQMAREEFGRIAGPAAMLGVFLIMIVLIAVLGLVVVNAMKHSPWATATVGATVPIAIVVGLYLRVIRPGRVIEGTAIGVALLLLAVIAGGWVDQSDSLRGYFDHGPLVLAGCVIGYGFLAAALPVWLLLAPRDYLSTTMKLGTVVMLAFAILLLRPELRMPALTRFVDGRGPVFAGAIFPFLFVTIACGAISGFHALIASGTTPKLLCNERDIRMVGYGSMQLESCVAVMALIAASLLDPGVFFAINSPAGIVGADPGAAVAKISSWGFPVSTEQMSVLAAEMGEASLYARTGGAPSLAVGMAAIFAGAFGRFLTSVWYHFALMFEALFILTTLDAGTRVGRYLLQDLVRPMIPALGDTHSYRAAVVASALVVGAWGYFLYVGVIDPNGGVNLLWPLFGLANQMLAGIALSLALLLTVRSGRWRYAWVPGLPLAWLAIIATTAAWQKLFSSDVRVGFLASASDLQQRLLAGALTDPQAAVAGQLIFNQRLDAALVVLFLAILWLVIIDVVRAAIRYVRDPTTAPSREARYERTQLESTAEGERA
jgi:carbon starvation protein